jgi:hypothetical protein
MFQENKKKFQVNLFGMVHQFPLGVKKMLDKSWAPAFRKLVFEKIDESRYTVLFSDIPSRPNFPVNVWVGLEIIKALFDYTDEELIEQWHFNLLTAYALGQDGLGELTLSIRTIYYNRERLLDYENKTSCNLLEQEFRSLTDDVLKKLGVDTNMQRMDSSFVGSYIKQMSRLELVVKVLQNFYKDLTELEQKHWQPVLAEYVDEEAQHLSYRLRRSEIEKHLKKVGEWLFKLHQSYADDTVLTGLQSYHHLGRVLNEQYQVISDKEKTNIEVKPAKEISASSLQNPADDTATYRIKGGESHVGDIFNVSETCTPDNSVQLVTDIAVYPNTKADENIAAERVPEIKLRMELREMITDAGFTGEKSEKVCENEHVTLIPTEMLGRKLSPDELSLKDFQFTDGIVTTCPSGKLPVSKIHKDDKEHWIIRFSREQCADCSMVTKCPVRGRQEFFSLSFSDRQAVLAQRRQKLKQEEYREKCRLRPAVEGTISEFKHKMRNGKLRVRGIGRVRNTIILMAIGINFGRIWAYLTTKQTAKTFPPIFVTFYVFISVLVFGVKQLSEYLQFRRLAYSYL